MFCLFETVLLSYLNFIKNQFSGDMRKDIVTQLCYTFIISLTLLRWKETKISHIVYKLFTHHRLDAVLLFRDIERIAYVDADERAEFRSPTSSSFCFCGDVHHCLDSVYCRPVFPKLELIL